MPETGRLDRAYCISKAVASEKRSRNVGYNDQAHVCLRPAEFWLRMAELIDEETYSVAGLVQ